MDWKSFTFRLILIVVTATVTYFGTRQFSKDENKLQYLDVDLKIEDDVIGKPFGIENEVLVTLGEDTINKMSRISFNVFNFTGKDYSNVPFYIELSYPSGEEVNVLSSIVYGEEQMTDQVKTDTKLSPSISKGTYKIKYILNTLNQSVLGNNLKPAFTAIFYIKGNTPIHKMNVDYKSLDEREVNWEQIYQPEWYKSGWFLTLCIIAFYIFVIIFIVKLSNIRAKKRDEEISEYIAKKVQDEDKEFTKMTLKSDFNERVTAYILYFRELYFWEKTSKLLKFVRREKEPKKPE